MKQLDILLSTTKYMRDIGEQTDTLRDEITNDFTAISANNKDINTEFDLNRSLANYTIASSLSAYATKMYNTAKTEIDLMCIALDIDPNPVAGSTTLMYDGNQMQFSKRQNNDSVSTSAKDLATELNKLGVDPEMIAKAMKAATKSKRGGIYYIVEAKD